MASSKTRRHYLQFLSINEDANKNLSDFSIDSNFANLPNLDTQIKRNFHADKDTNIPTKA